MQLGQNIETEIQKLQKTIREIRTIITQGNDEESAKDNIVILNHFENKIDFLKSSQKKLNAENFSIMHEAFNEYKRLNSILQSLQLKTQDTEIRARIQKFYAECRMATVWDQLDLAKLKEIYERLNIKELEAIHEKSQTQTVSTENKTDSPDEYAPRKRSKAVTLAPLSKLPIKTTRNISESLETRTSEVDVVERFEDYRNFVSTYLDQTVTPKSYNERLEKVVINAPYFKRLIETSNIIYALEGDSDEPYKCTNLFKQHIKTWLLTDREKLKDAFQTKEAKTETYHTALSDLLITDLLCHSECLLKLDLSKEEKEKLLQILITKPELCNKAVQKCSHENYERLSLEKSLEELFKDKKQYNELREYLNKQFKRWPEQDKEYTVFLAEEKQREAERAANRQTPQLRP